MAIQLLATDITTIACDAIVNSAHPALGGIGPDLPPGVGGVDGAIHRKAGRGLHDHCISLPVIGTIWDNVPMRCRPGECIVTPGFEARAPHIIHVVAPFYTDYEPRESFDILRCCYESIGAALNRLGVVSFALPPLGTRAFRIPKEPAVKTAVEWMKSFNRVDISILVSVIDSDEYQLYARYLRV